MRYNYHDGVEKLPVLSISMAVSGVQMFPVIPLAHPRSEEVTAGQASCTTGAYVP